MRICRFYSLDDPKKAGAMTAEQLCGMGKQYPHLIPCGALGWRWTYKKTCAKCDGHPTQITYSQRLMRRAYDDGNCKHNLR